MRPFSRKNITQDVSLHGVEAPDPEHSRTDLPHGSRDSEALYYLHSIHPRVGFCTRAHNMLRSAERTTEIKIVNTNPSFTAVKCIDVAMSHRIG
jgi:hypothetical protein